MPRVTVLVGGESSEREISLATGLAIARALEGLGWELTVIDTGRPDGSGSPMIDFGADGGRPDLVFIALHGGAGEDGRVQAQLDELGIPYTGCGPAASALAMDKWRAKAVLREGGLTLPGGFMENVPVERIPDPGYVDELARRIETEPGWPAVVKPNREGSSVGLAICAGREQASLKLPRVIRVSTELLIEPFIAGREITCTLLGPADAPRALPLVEIIAEGGLYDYEHKYEKGKTRYVCPAELPAALTERIQEESRRAWELLGCRHLARVDFRLAEDGTPYCLELNTIPGMTETSLVPMAAAAVGLDFPALVAEIAALALNETAS